MLSYKIKEESFGQNWLSTRMYGTIQDGLQGEMVVSPCTKARKVKVCISPHRRRIMISYNVL